MTHDELIRTLKSENFRKSRTAETPYFALLAVVELHKPGGYEYFEKNICEYCTLDIDHYVFYPCPTIEIIEKELS